MEGWKVTIDDEELLYESRHYEHISWTMNLDNFNAYDDKGNKIDGKYIKFIKKEYDNIRR